MKKMGLICATLLAGLSLSACSNLASQQSHKASSSSSTKVAEHRKEHKKQNKRSKSSSTKASMSSSSATSGSSSTESSNATHADTSDPRVQAAIQKGLMNPDGSLTRNGRDLKAMVTGTDLDSSDWNDSDYTETYNNGQVGRAPIYGGSTTSSSSQSSAESTAPGTGN